MWWTLGSVPISPKQSLYWFKKFHLGELEMGSILLIRFNCLLEFSPMTGGEFVSATINNKETFLPRWWMSKVHCPFTVMLLPLYALRVVVDFVILGFLCRVAIWFSGSMLTCAPESILQQMLVPLVLSVTDPSAFVSSAIVLICWLLFMNPFEVSQMAPMKKLSLSKVYSVVVSGVFWLSR